MKKILALSLLATLVSACNSSDDEPIRTQANADAQSANLEQSSAAESSAGDQHTQDLIKVYKSDGSLQCGQPGIHLETMMTELTDAGLDVRCAHQSSDGFIYSSACGSNTGRINVYQIDGSTLTDAQSLGFEPVSNLSDYVDTDCDSVTLGASNDESTQVFELVYRSNESIQCESDGISPEDMQRSLSDSGIDVSCAEAAHDGLFRSTVCGGDTGQINVFEIPGSAVNQASTLGFSPINELSSDYADTACRS